MAWDLSSPNTGASVAGQIDPHQMWKRGVDIFEQTRDFFQQFEGNSPSSGIRTITDTSKGRGHRITFTSMAGLYNEAKHAEDLFESSTDFEKLTFNEDDLVLDVLRHATRYSERMEEHMGMRGEIVSGLPAELGKWLGRTKSERMAMMFREKGDSSNTVFAGDSGGADDLTSADTLSFDEVIKAGVRLERLGGRPAETKTVNGNTVECKHVCSTTDGLYALELDDNYKTILRDGGERGDTNFLFKGGYSYARGHSFHKWNPIDHDGDGAIASPWNPKAYVHTDGAGAILDGSAFFGGANANTKYTLNGGGSRATTPAAAGIRDYFKYFPKMAFKFNEQDILTAPAAGTDDFYIIVYNPPDATGVAADQKNKFGFAKVETNNGHNLVLAEVLSTTLAGTVFKQTVGSVTNASGPFAGLICDDWAEDALIMLANSKGQTYGWSLMMGAEAARRGYGKHRNKRGEETHEDGYITDVFVRTYFGQQPRMDASGAFPGYVMIAHAINYAGVPTPTIT